MSDVKAGTKELRELVRRFKPGYHIVSDGKAKVIVIGPDGRPVLRKDGSGRHLGMPNSPHPSSLKEHEKRLKDHGVLRDDLHHHQHDKTRYHLVRDDLAAAPDPSENNVASKALINDLDSRGVHPPISLRDYDELNTVVAHVSGLEQWLINDTTMRLYNGMPLTKADREPFEQLIAILETEEDPISLRFRLLRQARGLPDKQDEQPEEPTEQEEQTVEIDTTMPAAQAVQEMVGNFVSDISERIDAMYEEINKLEDLRKTLEEQYPSIQIEAGEQEPDTSLNGGGTTPQRQGRPRSTTPRASAGSHADKVWDVIKEGGEWTQKEIIEASGVAQSQVSYNVRQMVESGKIVMTHPGSGTRHDPAKYGSSEFYSKQV